MRWEERESTGNFRFSGRVMRAVSIRPTNQCGVVDRQGAHTDKSTHFHVVRLAREIQILIAVDGASYK